MKMRIITLLSSIIFNCSLVAQSPLAVFENLVGSKWEVEGKWNNGEDFKQEYLFEWSLDKKMIKVKTYGTINMLTGEYGQRNEGVRFWKEDDKKIKFYEFDIFGGITEGICTVDGSSIFYTYEYQGLTLQDSWVFEDNDSYSYVVESLENGAPKEVFLTCMIKRKE